MKFKCTVTEEVIQKTAMCGLGEGVDIARNCLFAYIYNCLVGNVIVRNNTTIFLNKAEDIIIGDIDNGVVIKNAISLFDDEKSIEQRRKNFLGKEYELEIPDEVIEYWHGDSVKAAQHLIDNPILQPA